jgi:hypothetical protein
MVQARKVSVSQRQTVQLRQTFFYFTSHGTVHIAPSNGKTAALQRRALRKLSKNKLAYLGAKRPAKNGNLFFRPYRLREARGKQFRLSSIVGSKVWSACTGCRQEKLAYLSAKWSDRANFFFYGNLKFGSALLIYSPEEAGSISSYINNSDATLLLNWKVGNRGATRCGSHGQVDSLNRFRQPRGCRRSLLKLT